MTSPPSLFPRSEDPISANLDRIQIVKGWVDRGQVFEQILDIAWAMDAEQLRAFVVGNTLRVVNVVTGEEGLVTFAEEGVQTITLPPHRVIRQEYEISSDGRLHQPSVPGLPATFQILDVDGSHIAAATTKPATATTK